MAIAKMKPTSPGRRHQVRIVNKGLHKGKPHKALLESKSKSGGRNNAGRITLRHRGGGHKQHYRIIDFKRNSKDGIVGVVETIEYDPNRTANIALIKYADGERLYIIAPKGLELGAKLETGAEAPIATGNALPMINMPVGTVVHCVEMKPKKGAQMARSAGTSAQIVAREGRYVTLRLRSGEMRKILSECRAVIGTVSNPEHSLVKLGKAGAKRHRGIRPTVRGVAMNPVDHPHGGGEGKTAGGRHPVSPWGTPAKGFKTRKNKRTDKMIVRRRNKAKR